MKKCFKCGVEKELIEFYKHRQMKDGHLNKCKSCTKSDSIINHDRNIREHGDVYIEKERARGREKYKRLNYSEKYHHRIRTQKYTWMSHNRYQNCRRNYISKHGKLDPMIELHHWSYNDEHFDDVILLSRRSHKLAHNQLILDVEMKMFRTKNGDLLDTKEKHIDYITPFLIR